jgi:hypothetical protein
MDYCYVELYAAIVKQAMADYKAALKCESKKALKTRRECENFFLSEYGQMLSVNNGERIIKMCRDEVEAKTK